MRAPVSRRSLSKTSKDAMRICRKARPSHPPQPCVQPQDEARSPRNSLHLDVVQAQEKEAGKLKWKSKAGFVGLLSLVGAIRKKRRQRPATTRACVTKTRMWTLEAKDKIASEPVKSGNLGGPEASLTAYSQRPLSELATVKMAYGASLEHVGPNPHAAGEELFDVKVPPLNIPGIGEISPVATCVVRKKPGAVQIEGKKVQVMRGSEDMTQGTQFTMLVEMQWIDTAEKQELIFKGNFKLGLDLPPAVTANLSQDIFENVGNAAMGVSVDTLAKGFVRSFAEDYDRWATEQ